MYIMFLLQNKQQLVIETTMIERETREKHSDILVMFVYHLINAQGGSE